MAFGIAKHSMQRTQKCFPSATPDDLAISDTYKFSNNLANERHVLGIQIVLKSWECDVRQNDSARDRSSKLVTLRLHGTI